MPKKTSKRMNAARKESNRSLPSEGRQRIVIENVQPEINGGRFPIKRVIGEKVIVTADIFSDGHDVISASLLYCKEGQREWKEVRMVPLDNDRWRGEFIVTELGIYEYTLKGWANYFKTWQEDLKKKYEAGQDIRVELLIGARYIEEVLQGASKKNQGRLLQYHSVFKNNTDPQNSIFAALSNELEELMELYPKEQCPSSYDKVLSVVVDREKALFSAWYECFPRSASQIPGRHGTFKDCEALLPEISRMGFDILYFPPIHPIGKTNRKGKNNSPKASPDDVGSPWAIGSEEGGHKAIHPQLGSFQDFERLIKKAKEIGIEIALDLAYQCSMDHPYLKDHPEWFRKRPDGSIQFAENPPKKYEDIVPINFETENWKELWEELKSVVLFWINKGVKIFRVDNPHTKTFLFWEWLIPNFKREYPDVIFLSEAFTRPKVMYRLAKVGFTQSYTYFTWRNSKQEFIDYLTELTQTKLKEYFKPNFWPNTPDILPPHLQSGERPAFLIRFIMAATLSSNYGIYGPPFELCVKEALPDKEEYLHSEKYEIKNWHRDAPGHIKDLITKVNRIRRENPALQTTNNIKFCEIENDQILCYLKANENLSNILLIVINLNPHHTQSGWVKIPISEFGIDPNQSYTVHDLLGDTHYQWKGERNYVELIPEVKPSHILRIR